MKRESKTAEIIRLLVEAGDKQPGELAADVTRGAGSVIVAQGQRLVQIASQLNSHLRSFSLQKAVGFTSPAETTELSKSQRTYARVLQRRFDPKPNKKRHRATLERLKRLRESGALSRRAYRRSRSAAKASYRAAGGGLGRIAGLGRMAGMVAGFPLLMGGLAKLSHSFAERQVPGQRETAKFAGGSAAAYARLDFADIGRQFAKAQATEGSTTGMVEAVNEMRDALAPLDVAWTNTKNNIAAAISKQITSLVTAAKLLLRELGFDTIVDKVDNIDKNLDKQRDGFDKQMGNAFHDAIVRNDFREKRPRRRIDPLQ